jgi:DNA ligase (NAD+)
VQTEYLGYFTRKGAFNIVGLGEKLLRRFYERGLVRDAADIFDLKEEILEGLEGMGEKSAKKIVSAIDHARRIPLARFIYSLGILHVGEETARDLAEYFRSVSRLRSAREEELLAVPNIGSVVAHSIKEWFTKKANASFLDKLLTKGIEVENPKGAAGGPLLGKTFVFTGTLERYGRQVAEEEVRRRGGNVSSSVSKKTDYVVVGREPGSKKEKAESLGITILSEAQFAALLT